MPSRDPSATAANPSSQPPAPMDDKQLVAGRDPVVASDLYYIDDDGNRAMIHDTALLTRMQQRLTIDGFYRGAADGRTSPELSASIRQFQAKKGLAETGVIDHQTADAMGLDWAKLSAPAGTTGTTADKVGDKVRAAGKTVETKAGELGRDVKQGAQDLRKDVNKSDTVKDVETGAKDVGRDIKTGAEKVGDKVETGTKDAARAIEKGAGDAKRKLEGTK